MITKIKVLRQKFRKHKYVSMEEVYKPLSNIEIPVHVCKKCGSRLYLDHWQTEQLPKDMKYGCSGKH